MAHWVYGVDSSYDELTATEARRLKDNGVQVYAQCLWTAAEQPEPRVRSLRNALNAGIPKLVGYISINRHHDGAWHVDRGREGVPDDIWNSLARVPIDVELSGLTLAHVNQALDRAAALGKPKDVYTNYNTWVNTLGNPTRPEGVGLWNAIWDDNPDFDFPRLRFGGWQDGEVWGEQWSGGTNVFGQFADRNQFRASALGLHVDSPVPVTPVPVTPVPTPPYTVVLLRYAGSAPVYLAHLWHVPNLATLDSLKRAGVAGPVVVQAVPPASMTAPGSPLRATTGLLLQYVGTPMVFFTQLWHVPNMSTLDALRRAGIPGPLDVKVS